MDREAYHKRYAAFLAERLLSVYIENNKLPVVYCNIRYDENILIHNLRIMSNKLNLNKKLFKHIRAFFSEKTKSSYLK